ncbi:MAG: OmpA family protein [Proteobacteria bacterium]|nr:OmpA family protein [Pseudomonadota bacterium]
MTFHGVTNRVAQFAVVALLATGASACSSIPEWLGGDSKSSDDTVQPPADQTADNTATTDQTATDNSKFPDLADVPDKPKQPSTPDERKQVQSGLVADRNRSQYSSDQLKGGQDTAAAPPPPPGTEVADTTPDTTPPADTTDKTTDTDKTAKADNKTPPVAAPPVAAPTTRVATAPMQPSTGIPAVPANAPGVIPGQAQVSDAALGFQRSTAPALDGNVQNFVPQAIIARYRQTAAASNMLGVTNVAVSANNFVTAPTQPAVSLNPPAGTRKAKLGTNTTDIGGTENMTGAVVANFDSLAGNNAMSQQAVYSNAAGLPPQAVVFFPHDTTILNAQARAQVRAAAQAYLSRGGQGFIRVVGHSSSRTANMPLQRHLVYNFERSQARATSVAQALIKAGVPASKVLVEAVGDTQPVYYESMPEGEEGNRRAEIFLQS